MRAAVLATAIPLAGCLDLELDFEGQSVAVATRDFRLTISGCADDGLLGCGMGAGTMEAVLDGRTHPVPVYEPAPFELFPNRAFELIVPSPEDPDVKVFLNGQGVHVEELPWFELALARPGTPSRAAGPVRLVFDAFRDADVTAALTSQCGTRQSFDPIDAAHIGAGLVEIPVDNPRLEGECTHELRVTQTVSVPNDHDIWLTSARTVQQIFATSP